MSGIGPVVSTALGEGWGSVSAAPLPSFPPPSLPQHQAVASAAIAQVPFDPAVIAAQVSGIGPAVSTGLGEGWLAISAAPFPNCGPLSFPQHQAVASAAMAQT